MPSALRAILFAPMRTNQWLAMFVKMMFDIAFRMVTTGALQIGMCNGMLQRKRPTATGQADYYGVVANTAARVMALAEPGQVLVEGNLPFIREGFNRHDKAYKVAVKLESEGMSGDVTLAPHGTFKLKGLSRPTSVFRVCLIGYLYLTRATAFGV